MDLCIQNDFFLPGLRLTWFTLVHEQTVQSAVNSHTLPGEQKAHSYGVKNAGEQRGVVVQSLSHVRLYDPMDCSTPGLPVVHYLPEFAQTHVHCISDVIQPLHPLSAPSPLPFNLSQHQGLFQ